MQTAKEMRGKIVGRAAADKEFRALLIRNPKQAIRQELGVNIPASMSIKVYEESRTTAHLVLPPFSRLDKSDLEAIAMTSGGARIDAFRRWFEELISSW